MNENKYSYTSQFAILIGSVGLAMILAAVLLAILGPMLLHVPLAQVQTAINEPQHVDASRVLNTLISFIAFFLPPLLLAKLVSRRPFKQLGFAGRANLQQVLLVVLIAFGSIVLGGALSELNEKIPLPATWTAKAKAMEDTYQQATMGMLQMKNFTGYLVSLFVLAVCPALFEETLFRGGFQQVLIGWTKSKWAGIILTSILFSAVHFSYFGFLTRTALGIVLGLIFYYSKNLWLNILIHFVNNALVVTQLYILGQQGKSIDKAMDESMPLWWGAIALIVLMIFIRVFRQKSEEELAKYPSHILYAETDDEA